MLLIIIALLVTSYLFGSIPFGYILTKIFTKQDIRQTGSGNIGATNVLRTGKKKLALATLILDVLKCLPAIAGAKLVYEFIYSYTPELRSIEIESFLLIGGLFAIIGHCFPVWLKFKGGKGVATAVGVLLVSVPYAGLAAIATWLIMVMIFRISSLSALIAALVAPIITFFIYGLSPAIICTIITILIWIRHKDNIKRLLNSNEPKIGHKKKEKNAKPVSK